MVDSLRKILEALTTRSLHPATLLLSLPPFFPPFSFGGSGLPEKTRRPLPSFASGLSCALPPRRGVRNPAKQQQQTHPNPPPPSGYVGGLERGGEAARSPERRAGPPAIYPGWGRRRLPGRKGWYRRVRDRASSRLSPMRMRICFLPKRREKSEEMVRPMAAPGWGAAAQGASGMALAASKEGWGGKGRRQATRTPVPPARFLSFAAFLSGGR